MTGFWICIRFSTCHSSEYVGFQYPRVLNMLLTFNLPGLWIYMNTKYTRVLIMSLVLNILGFWIYQNPTYLRVLNMPLVLIMPGLQRVVSNAWIWLINSWICLNMQNTPEYAWIWLNNFCFTCPHCNHLAAYMQGYLIQLSLQSEEIPGGFLDKTKFVIFYGSWKYLICFLF